jgi:hypothetical protein
MTPDSLHSLRSRCSVDAIESMGFPCALFVARSIPSRRSSATTTNNAWIKHANSGFVDYFVE